MARMPLRVRNPMPVAGLKTAWPADGLPPGLSPKALNVRFRLGTVTHGPGRRLLSGYPTGGESVIYNIGRFSKVNGTVWAVMLASSGLMYRLGNGTPGTPRQWYLSSDTMSQGSGRYWLATGEDRLFIARSGLPTIFVWDGTTSHAVGITATAGTVIPGKYVEYFDHHLITANVVEDEEELTNRLRWADNGDYRKWDGGSSGFLDLFEPEEEPITGMKQLGARLVVFRRHSITDVYPTGTAEPVFKSEVRVTGIGCAAPYTIDTNGQELFFLGPDRVVYGWDGSRLRDLTTDRIEDQLEALISDNSMLSYFGAVSTTRREYWLVLGNGDAFIYDYARDVWSRDSYGVLTALGEVIDVQNSETWDSIETTWDTEYRTWDQMAGTQFATFFGGTVGGATFIVDATLSSDYFDTATDRYVETGDIYFPSLEEGGDPNPWEQGTIQRVMLVYEYIDDNPVEFGISTDRGKTWHVQEVTPDPTGVSITDDFNITTHMVRFRFREYNANGRFLWNSYGFEFIPAGPFSPGGATA